MNKSQRTIVNKILNAEYGQYKRANLIQSYKIASASCGIDNDYDEIITLTEKMKELMAEPVEVPVMNDKDIELVEDIETVDEVEEELE